MCTSKGPPHKEGRSQASAQAKTTPAVPCPEPRLAMSSAAPGLLQYLHDFTRVEVETLQQQQHQQQQQQQQHTDCPR
ncbi:hypothetical protein E2C01_053065 [Portunus trituberculatus]|uniref:Uncharacterized protein n=1 Tax=Portunus trituberculatus TaxID=210409 RepID=A0A5B7GFG0_PORTR|nr:hypothetical protein [Portunus trituberculatus]